MKNLSKIAGVNLLILTVYTLIIHLIIDLGVSSKGDKSLSILLVSIIPIAIHVSINVLLSIVYFIKKENSLGKSFLLSSLIVLVIGFSSCWGGAILIGSIGPG